MKKRAISFLLCVNILVVTLCARLWGIAVDPQTVATESGIRVKTVSSVRGMIYDRNLIPLVNTTYATKLLIKPTNEALSALKADNYGNETLSQLANGYFTILNAPQSKSYATEDIKELKVYERYGESTLLHIIGYTDQNGNGVCGIEKYYNQHLNECGGTLEVAYSTDAQGRMLLGEDAEVRNNNYYDKDGIVLTIDKSIQTITEIALKNHNIIKGAAVVTDVKSGEILACASLPLYDRNNLEEYIDDTDSPFINRAFTAYPLGSVFKVVTSAALLEQGLMPPDYYCPGYVIKNNTQFNCNNLTGHGYIDFETALSKSCNPYFIDLGITAGGESIIKTAQKAGFGKFTDFGNSFVTDSGILPQSNELNSNAAVGNFAFGQGKLTATPIQIASLMTIIANNGYSKELKLIAGFTDKKGSFTPNLESASQQILKKETCAVLKTAMAQTSTNGTGKAAFSSLYTCCTKTATAQSGQYNEDGTEIMYCWFAGFLPADEPQYAICIMKEDGISGGADCGPVFKEIAENIIINQTGNKN